MAAQDVSNAAMFSTRLQSSSLSRSMFFGGAWAGYRRSDLSGGGCACVDKGVLR
jgi:hypothetical protein